MKNIKTLAIIKSKNLNWLKYVFIDDILYLAWFLLLEKSYKYFIGHKDDDHKMLSRTSACVKSYHSETKWMNFLIKDDNLLKKCNDILAKVCHSIKKNLTANPSISKYF